MKTKRHSISGAFVFMLLGAFAVFSMLLVVLGAQAYRTTVDGASAHTRKRIAAAFVRNAVRAQDERGAIAVEDSDGLPVLALDALNQPEQAEFLKGADLVLDGVYGTGFHGALRPAGLAAARWMNEAPGKVLALDLPSGLEADSGNAAEGAVQAELTVTFHAAKPCHRLAAAQCGRVEVADIGITAVLNP